jgi:hypothetical protein
MAYDDIYRIIASRSFAVNSVGGAQASTTVLSSQTYAVDLVFPGSTSSTSGCRFVIGGPTDAVSSTQASLLPANWPQRYKVTPGQTVGAISNDAGTFSLTVIELSK